MMGSVSTRYALRSLLRHPRRTLLSMLGVGIGCAMGIMATSWVGGGGEMQIRAASESGAGHLRVVPAGWVGTRDNSLRLADWEKAEAEVRALAGLRGFAPRARANGLLAMGNRTAGVEVAGVVPQAEQATNRLVRNSRILGRYLRTGDSGMAVIGAALAEKLDVELDDDLHVTLVGRDEMQSAMLTIVGILSTGSRDIDSAICHVTLEDLAAITGYEGPAEIAVMLEHHRLIDEARAVLAGRITGGNTVITWKEVNPEIAANVDGDKAFTRLLVGIIVIVVSLGITSAQLTGVLERRREFGILMALGMKDRHFMGLIALEAVLIGLGGAVVALLLGGPVAYLLATKGVDISSLMGGDFSFGGVLLDPVMYGEFGAWVVWYAFVVSMAATLVASLYPARFAARTDPADALRVG